MADDKNLLENGKSLDTEKESKSGNDFVNDDDIRMGLYSWRPDWLQRFNSINWFMVALCLASLMQGIIVNGITLGSLPTIEKEFGLSSKISGFIVAGNDVSALMLIGIVSFFGTRGNKPKWIGIGSIVTGIGVLLFALPKLIIGSYKPVIFIKNTTTSFDMCNPNKPTVQMSGCDGNTDTITILNIAIFFIAQLIMGAGTTPLYSLGPAFVDENVSPRASPIYLGVLFASTMLGPGLGFILGGTFLSIFTNIDLPKGLEDMIPRDPRWIGAWWLGYAAFFGIFFICGFVLLLFPSKIKSESGLKRQKSIKDGHLPSIDHKMEYTLKGYIKQCFRICMNKVFMLTVFALTIRTLYGAGLATFLVKILVIKFGVSPQDAAIYLGAIIVPSMLIGILAGACGLRKIQVKLAAKSAAKFCFIITIICIANSAVFLIPGCQNTNMAGKKVPYFNSTSMDSYNSQCNHNCLCSEKMYMPICGSDGVTYHNPCFAGCTSFVIGKDMKPMFGNCTCIPVETSDNKSMLLTGFKIQPMGKPPMGIPPMGGPQSNSSQVMSKMPKMDMKTLMMKKMAMMAKSFVNSGKFGTCDRDCKNFYVFVVIIVFSISISFLSSTPHQIMLLRSVPDNQRSFALGVQFLIMRSLSFLPAPIILGAVLDSQCITWGYTSCGKKQNCYDYDVDNLSVNLVLLGVVTSLLTAILYGLAWWWYPNYEDKNANLLTDENGAAEEEKL